MSRKKKEDLGPCRMGCGRKATVAKHDVCTPCYSSLRVWSNVKTPEQRADYLLKLVLRQRRVTAIDAKEVIIGTSPYNWRKRSNVIALNLHRRQRGSVR